MKRGQVSVEFLAIFGFIFLMTIPLIYIFFDQSGYVQDNIAQNHIRNIQIKIADEAEIVYYLGEPSKTTIKAYFPAHIEYINIFGRSMVFGFRNSKNTLQNITHTSLVNITGVVSHGEGIHYITLEATGEGVSITG